MKKILLSVVAAILIVELQGYAIEQSSPRIVNGKPSRPGQFPYQVMIIGWVNSGRILCGGSLLSKEWVITAAHCASGVWMFEVHLGAQSLNNYTEPGRVILNTNQAIVHEAYYPALATNDIALIRLPRKVNFTSQIQPVSLTSSQDLLVNRTVVASGWGLMSTGALQPASQLQYADLQVLPNAQCTRIYDPSIIKNSTLCAAGVNLQSVCSGDSGGPLVLSGTRILVGVTSFGSSVGCNYGYPNGFSRVSSYLNWIQSKTGIKAQKHITIFDEKKLKKFNCESKKYF